MENGVESDQAEWSDAPTDVVDDMFDEMFLAHGVEMPYGLGRDTALEAGEDADDDVFACAAEVGDEEASADERVPS